MPSYAESLFRRAGAPLLSRVCAERDNTGKVKQATLTTPNGPEFTAPEWLGNVTLQQVSEGLFDTVSDHVLWNVEAKHVPEGFLPLSGNEVVTLPSHPEAEFSIDLDRSQIGGAVHTFALTRVELLGMASMERGARA